MAVTIFSTFTLIFVYFFFHLYLSDTYTQVGNAPFDVQYELEAVIYSSKNGSCVESIATMDFIANVCKGGQTVGTSTTWTDYIKADCSVEESYAIYVNCYWGEKSKWANCPSSCESHVDSGGSGTYEKNCHGGVTTFVYPKTGECKTYQSVVWDKSPQSTFPAEWCDWNHFAYGIGNGLQTSGNGEQINNDVIISCKDTCGCVNSNQWCNQGTSQCECKAGWYGDDCSCQVNCSIAGGHTTGECVAGECTCKTNWGPVNQCDSCNLVGGKFNPNFCNGTCLGEWEPFNLCTECNLVGNFDLDLCNGTCLSVWGPPGECHTYDCQLEMIYDQVLCDGTCATGRFGNDCSCTEDCSIDHDDHHSGECVNGICECSVNWGVEGVCDQCALPIGFNLDLCDGYKCTESYYGPDCEYLCDTECLASEHKVCIYGPECVCTDQWVGNGCDDCPILHPLENLKGECVVVPCAESWAGNNCDECSNKEYSPDKRCKKPEEEEEAQPILGMTPPIFYSLVGVGGGVFFLLVLLVIASIFTGIIICIAIKKKRKGKK